MGGGTQQRIMNTFHVRSVQGLEAEVFVGHHSVCLPSVYQTSPHAIISPRPSPYVLPYGKQSETGGGNGWKWGYSGSIQHHLKQNPSPLLPPMLAGASQDTSFMKSICPWKLALMVVSPVLLRRTSLTATKRSRAEGMESLVMMVHRSSRVILLGRPWMCVCGYKLCMFAYRVCFCVRGCLHVLCVYTSTVRAGMFAPCCQCEPKLRHTRWAWEWD